MASPTDNDTYGTAAQRKQPLKAAGGARTVGQVYCYFPAASARTHASICHSPAGAVAARGKPSSPVAAHGQARPWFAWEEVVVSCPE